MTFDLVLIGFGHVGRRFAMLIRERARQLARDGITLRVIGIATLRHGHVFAAAGLDAATLARRPRTRPVGPASDSTAAFLRRAISRRRTPAREGRAIAVETTTLDIRRGEPAISHVRTALALGAHVVTANKGPSAFAYAALTRAAARAKRRFLFEGAVMDGVPIFNLVRDTLPTVTVAGFRGVVNSTTNFMLTAMEHGQTFEAALQAMQEAGIAEADPSLDVDGWDAAAKTATLANVLLDARITPHDVDREGLSAASGPRATAARAAGRRLKLVASAERRGRRVTARVALEDLAGNDVLAGLEGQQNALMLRTDLLDEIALVQRGGGLTQTAYALLADVVTIARDVRDSARAIRRSPASARRRRSP